MNYFRRIKEVGLICMLKKMKHVLFPDTDTLEIATRHGTYEYLQRYSYAFNWHRTAWVRKEKPKIIWTMWWQGIENAPLLVKRCIDSMHQYGNGFEVHVIDANNVHQYIQIPDYIEEKHVKGIIPNAHFSDIVRLLLLKHYGGVWIDSTIMLTDILPKYITDEDVFFYHSDGRGGVQMINPLIAACPNHPLIEDVLDLLLEYWKNENKLVSYIIMPLFSTMTISKSPLNRQLWEQVPCVYSATLIYLLRLLPMKFNNNTYDIVKELSPVHKLTYKYEQFGIDTEKKGTFYDVLINGNKPD